MGMFNVPICIGDPQRAHWIDLDALVDTGASVTAPLLGALVLEGVFMGVNPAAKRLEPMV